VNREQSGVLYIVAAFTLAVLWGRGYLTDTLTKVTALFTTPAARRPFAIGGSPTTGWGGGAFTVRRPT
jgi:hypothetical protein